MASVLLLGANSDMAVAMARRFAKNKFDVILAARNTEPLALLKSDLEIRYGVRTEAVVFDALSFADHQTFYKNLPFVPDVTICVFGYLGDQQKAMNEWTEAEKTLYTNYVGAVSILNVVAKDYERRKEGTIVGISSVAGERGRQSNFMYGSAKAGFTAYLSGLRNQLHKNNVNVITVLPGFVYTKMTENLTLPPALTAKPEQVAEAVYDAVIKKKNVVYVKWMWRWIMLIIKNIPEPVFKKMKL